MAEKKDKNKKKKSAKVHEKADYQKANLLADHLIRIYAERFGRGHYKLGDKLIDPGEYKRICRTYTKFNDGHETYELNQRTIDKAVEFVKYHYRFELGATVYNALVHDDVVIHVCLDDCHGVSSIEQTHTYGPQTTVPSVRYVGINRPMYKNDVDVMADTLISNGWKCMSFANDLLDFRERVNKWRNGETKTIYGDDSQGCNPPRYKHPSIRNGWWDI